MPKDHGSRDVGERRLSPGEGMTAWVLWMTYGSFYFCRQNIGVAVPLIED